MATAAALNGSLMRSDNDLGQGLAPMRPDQAESFRNPSQVTSSEMQGVGASYDGGQCLDIVVGPDVPQVSALSAATPGSADSVVLAVGLSRRQLVTLGLAVSLALLVALLPIGFSSEQGEAQRCLGILIFVAVSWTFEPMPSHITALTVPLLAVTCRVMRVPAFNAASLVPGDHCAQHPLDNHSTPDPGDPMSPDAAAAVLSASFFDPIIFLFVSGFAMAAAMDKHHISQRLAVMLLTRAGTRPSRVLLALMVLGIFMSMWLSNVAAAVLLSSVVRPVLRELPQESDWSKMVLLGIAFSCNLGGMTSPIASPQNVIALSSLKHIAGVEMSFVQWCMFAVPFVLFSSGLIWFFLRLSFKTGLPGGIEYCFCADHLPPMGIKHAFIILVVLLTVSLWCVFDHVAPVFGNLGILGLLPVLLFHGTQVLTKKEFNSMPWDVLILMGGGLALGNSVQSSGLLDILAGGIQRMLEGQGIWLTAFVFNVFAAVIANFLSSTVCAIILLPIIAKVGAELGHARMLTVGVCLMTSGAMGLPVSSFPNANSATVVTAQGTAILAAKDYARTGFPVALVILTLLSTVGFGTFWLLGW